MKFTIGLFKNVNSKYLYTYILWNKDFKYPLMKFKSAPVYTIKFPGGVGLTVDQVYIWATGVSDRDKNSYKLSSTNTVSNNSSLIRINITLKQQKLFISRCD